MFYLFQNGIRSEGIDECLDDFKLGHMQCIPMSSIQIIKQNEVTFVSDLKSLEKLC